MKMQRSCISNSKSKIKKGLVFVIIVGFVLHLTADVLTDRNSYYKNQDFFDEPQDIDVFFCGSSHMELFVNPIELYKKYGFTSYNFGSPDEPLQVTYWIIRNALKIKRPKLIVLDIYMFNQNKQPSADSIPYNLDSFPLSIEKIKAADDIAGDLSDRLKIAFRLERLHGRWKDLNRDITENNQYYVKGSFSYGYDHSMKVTPIYWNEYSDIMAVVSDDSIDLLYINKIINLCSENEIDLLFISTPFASTKEERMNMRAFNRFAQERNYPYVNMAETNNIIDTKVDMWDEGHVNASGMHKVTDYIGSYLDINYNLPDHHGEEEYKHWEHACNDYRSLKYESIMYKNDLFADLMMLNDKEITSYVYINTKYKGNHEEIFKNLLQNIGRENITVSQSDTLKSSDMNNLVHLDEMRNGYLMINDNSGIYKEYVGESAKHIINDFAGKYIPDDSSYDVIIAALDNYSSVPQIIKGYKRKDDAYSSENIYAGMKFKYFPECMSEQK